MIRRSFPLPNNKFGTPPFSLKEMGPETSRFFHFDALRPGMNKKCWTKTNERLLGDGR